MRNFGTSDRHRGNHRVSTSPFDPSWETRGWEPAIRQLPEIIGFLGYDREPEPQGLPNRIAYPPWIPLLTA